MPAPNVQLPPQLTGAAPMGHSPMGMKVGAPGAAAGAMAKVNQAVQILNQCVSELPIGSEAHTAVMDSIRRLSKAVPAGSQPPGIGATAIRDVAQEAQQSQPMQALMRMMGGGGGAGGGQPGGQAAAA